MRKFVSTVTAFAFALGGSLLSAQPSYASVPLPDGHANYVVAVMGGGLDAYWVRLAEYTFTPGTGTTGAVAETFWYWDMSTFTGDASTNKVDTGYTTAGCLATCSIRTPVGFEPGGSSKSLSGTYFIGSTGHIVINWTGGQNESWAIADSAGTYTHATLWSTSYNGLHGDAYGSNYPFALGASRETVGATHVTGPMWTAAYCTVGHSCPTINNGYIQSKTQDYNFATDYTQCTLSECLFHYVPSVWRSYFVVDPTNTGRRVYAENEDEGVDGYTGICFSTGGGHTWAVLQAVDDNGTFLGLVGAEASLNARIDGNAGISEEAPVVSGVG